MRTSAIVIYLAGASLLLAQPARKRDLASLGQLSESFQALAHRVSPSVVKVLSLGYRPPDEDDETESQAARQPSSGSGTIVDSNGYIVTNAHVVMGAERVQVLLPVPLDQTIPKRSTLKPKGRMLRAEVVGLDVETDIAVLKVPTTGLPALELGDSDSVEQGELVLALGSPLGLENSVSMGVVSSTARQLRPEDAMMYLQTDAPINPGNSGGPLVDAAGRVIGINTLLYSQSGGNEGIGFAAPSNVVRAVFEQIRQHRRVIRIDLGVETQTVTPLLASGWNLPQTWGVVVTDVIEDGPAEKASIEIGDMIASVNGKTMENARMLSSSLFRPGGDKVRLEILRGSQRFSVTVPAVEKLLDPERLAAVITSGQLAVPQLGILAVDLTPKITNMLTTARAEKGVLVAGRAAEGPFMEGTLRTGDIIYSVNRQGITSVDDLRNVMGKIKAGDPVAVQVERGGKLLFIAFEMP
ncbi:MAG: trypsin-like peptidase domain-containing protein [Bryobacteraceae bacterium]